MDEALMIGAGYKIISERETLEVRGEWDSDDECSEDEFVVEDECLTMEEDIRTENVRFKLRDEGDVRTENVRFKLRDEGDVRTGNVRFKLRDEEKLRTRDVKLRLRDEGDIRTENVRFKLRDEEDIRTENVRFKHRDEEKLRTEDAKLRIRDEGSLRTFNVDFRSASSKTISTLSVDFGAPVTHHGTIIDITKFGDDIITVYSDCRTLVGSREIMSRSSFGDLEIVKIVPYGGSLVGLANGRLWSLEMQTYDSNVWLWVPLQSRRVLDISNGPNESSYWVTTTSGGYLVDNGNIVMVTKSPDCRRFSDSQCVYASLSPNGHCYIMRNGVAQELNNIRDIAITSSSAYVVQFNHPYNGVRLINGEPKYF